MFDTRGLGEAFRSLIWFALIGMVASAVVGVGLLIAGGWWLFHHIALV